MLIACIVRSMSPLKGFLMHFKATSFLHREGNSPSFIITITVRIVGFSTISFTPFLLSPLPVPGVFGLTSRDEDAAFALALPGLRGPCPALHVGAEQREQTAYLTQITLSKLPGPVLVSVEKAAQSLFPCALSAALAHVRLPCLALLQPQPEEQHSAHSVQLYREFGEKLEVQANLAHHFRVLLGRSFLEGLFFTSSSDSIRVRVVVLRRLILQW